MLKVIFQYVAPPESEFIMKGAVGKCGRQTNSCFSPDVSVKFTVHPHFRFHSRVGKDTDVAKALTSTAKDSAICNRPTNKKQRAKSNEQRSFRKLQNLLVPDQKKKN